MDTNVTGKRVLVAALDWGLGHATRCIPIIRILLEQHCKVHLAGSGGSGALLRREFPELQFHNLPAYNPRYPKGGSMVWRMALQLPRFMSVIRQEHRILEEIVRECAIDLVISDNRYGCWSANVFSVFITHQSNILMPRRFGWLGPLVRIWNRKLVCRFDSCWIPDYPGDKNLSGALTNFGQTDFHPNQSYIGALSRFRHRPEVSRSNDIDVLAICSGPEPQRSFLEEILRKQLTGSRYRFVLVRGVLDGLPDETTERGRIVSFATTDELEELFARAATVVARSGYSTVMDLHALGKKAIFIPTPGQTEQEHLATNLLSKGVAFSMMQSGFDMQTAMHESLRFSGFKPGPADDHFLYDVIIKHLAPL